jgi:splicing factor 3B subunit 2
LLAVYCWSCSLLTLSQGSQTPAPETAHDAPKTTNPDDASANLPLQPVQPAKDDPIQDVPAVNSDTEITEDNPLYAQFRDVFARFQEAGEEEEEEDPALKEVEQEQRFGEDDNIQGEDEEEETIQRLSKKARKAATKLSIAELKAIVRKPEVVEWTDTSAHDPRLLVNIKSSRNVVPVPTHWSLKREYLSSKRGVEKPGFALPKFIVETGISDMRDAVLEKQAEASLKSRQRDRVQPKMGKLDVDYQKLYEAFFRRQTKPNLTRYGEVYYEGKEYETNLRHLRPGELSEDLKEALNMPPGAPPPWLINQQRFGPPPSYPAMKIPGLNSAPPPGAQWGFHAGGYGKPPLDDQGKPLWGGDVFGVAEQDAQVEQAAKAEPLDKSVWGELAPPEDEEEEEEEEDDEDEEDEDEDGREEDVGRGTETPFAGTATPGGIYSTVPTDLGTQSMADEFNLRKQRRGDATEESHQPRSAGTVLNERSIRNEGFFGGERAYDLSNSRGGPPIPVLGSDRDDRGRKRKAGDLDVSVDTDALERDDKLSKDEIRKRYEEQRERENAGGWSGTADRDDLTSMIAEEGAKRLKKDKERASRR